MGAVFRKHPTQAQPVPSESVRTHHPAPGFDPRGLSVDCLVWCRADAGITENGSGVSGWEDMSGNGNNFAQATASEQPSLNPGGAGGRPELLFDGSDDHMEGASPFGMITDKDSWTIVVVCGEDWTHGGVGGAFYQGRQIFDSSGPAWPTLGFNVIIGNQPRGGFYNGTAYPTTVTANITVGEPFVLAVIDDSGDMVGRVSGSEGATNSGAGSIQSSANGFVLGKGANSVSAQWSWWNAGISEFLVFDGALSEEEMEILESYLLDRYRIAA